MARKGPVRQRRVRMQEVTSEDFARLTRRKRSVEIEPPLGKGAPAVLPIGEPHHPTRFEPEEFSLETSTVWSFPKRGAWATHQGNYRGNWPPQIPRNLILRYTKPGDVVLDQMCGSGTTLIECKLLGRRGIGVDVNKNAVLLTRDRLNFSMPGAAESGEAEQKTYVGDARNLHWIGADSIDLVATHPPYANIIPYSRGISPNDLSQVHDVQAFRAEMASVAKESFRVLKPGHFAAILMGDTRRKQVYVPIAFRVLDAFLDAGFELKEDIIKRQWNCQGTPFWRKQSVKFNFHLIMHEHLFIFRKPA